MRAGQSLSEQAIEGAGRVQRGVDVTLIEEVRVERDAFLRSVPVSELQPKYAFTPV